jgi:hypothetical protein
MRKLFFLAVLAFGMNATAQNSRSVSLFTNHTSIQAEYNMHSDTKLIYSVGYGMVFGEMGKRGNVASMGLGYQFTDKFSAIGKIGLYPREDGLGYIGASGYYLIKNNWSAVLTVGNAGGVLIGANFKF